jgi:hypothetical protein
MALGTGSSRATTLLEMDIDSIADQAELVFVGTVVASESVQNINGQYRTYVTFQVEEVLKGSYPGDSLELSFLGGNVNGRGTVVSDSRLPESGETGIYFVESLSENLVNPLLGWSQGHFLISQDQQGIARITTNRREPVLDIQPMSEVPDLIRRPAGLVSGEGGRAMGVLVEETPGPIERGLTVDQFKSRLRRLLENRPQ